jgi:phosphoglucomutase
MVAHLRYLISENKNDFVGKTFGQFTVKEADDFEYIDPIDGSVSKNQVIFVNSLFILFTPPKLYFVHY